jgi:predicted aldo/keto reductase-like oxidoreductase
VQYRRLGKTALEVSPIGIGTEHMRGQPPETAISTIRAAIERGVNYFDVIFAMPDYLDTMREAFRGLRESVFLTAHLGSTERNGQYCKTRSAKRCEAFFHAHLSRLNTDHVDVLFLHNFNSVKDWETIVRPGGVLDLARRLRQAGKARFVGISGHFPPVMQRAVESGQVDVIMFPVNLFSHALPGRGELLDLCLRHQIGVVAMKPFGGGRLLDRRGTFRVPKYQTGGETFQVRIATEVTPVQCLSYTRAQLGVSLALAGVKTTAEMEAALHALEATEAECDYGPLLVDFGRYVEGECVYCNHCLPCPVLIDIGQVNRLLDAAQWGLTDSLRAAYHAMPVKASACTGCGACSRRCPFGVDVVTRIFQAVDLFEPAEAA